jgi:hypothetical protein
MRIEELKERLQNIGIDVSEKTLRRWGADGFIHDHLPTTKLPGIGRGNIEEWLEESFEEAAAFSAVRHSGITKQEAILSAEKVAEIKEAAHCLFESPKIFFKSPSEFTIVTPPQFIFDTQALELTVKDHELNNLAVTWIGAKEKARKIASKERAGQFIDKAQQKEEFSNRVKVIIDWYYDPPYVPIACRSMLIPELDEIIGRVNQPKEMARKIDRLSDQLIGQLDDEERERSRTERDAMRFTRGEPRLESLRSNKDELVVFLYSHQEFIEEQAARDS